MADEKGKSETALREEAILAFWNENRIFEKSLEKPAPKGEFVFYDGPPFATGLPHSGSLLSSVSKDVIPRYKTMRGYRVRRRWGWDTHGLPIESLVEQELGLKNKKEILAVGVKKFNETARAMVLRYVREWKRYVERVGRWVDFDNSYKTMDASYTESVWWALKEIYKKGNLYEGRKVLMYCPHCETPLAKAEIAMDNTYKDITEEAVTVKFRVKEPERHGLPAETYLLAWTTTPWTLPGNVALAVNPDVEYGVYERDGAYVILARAIANRNGFVAAGDVGEDGTRTALIKRGEELVGIAYEPLYEIPKVARHESKKKWTALAADFVATDEGTGIVHTAVIYGEDDYNLGVKEGLPMAPLLHPNATYNDDAPEFLRGQYIKKAEPLIKEDLERRGLLFSKAPNTHSYPHCYRCGTPLIYNAVSSWFINVQKVKPRLLAENKKIAWHPAHLKDGRFRHNLESAPDWTISRNRFWASPLPFWKDAAGNVTVIGSREELKARVKKSGNRYFVMRHGESENNVRNMLDSTDRQKWPLTSRGRAQCIAAGKTLAGEGITKIYASPFARTRESAEVVAKELGILAEAIVYDARLGDERMGDFEGKPRAELIAYRPLRSYDAPLPGGGESLLDVKRRFGAFLYETERANRNERILIVTHGIGEEVLPAIAAGADQKTSKRMVETKLSANAEILKLDFTPLPHNDNYELDYHLPYVDEVALVNEAGEPLTRVPEVVDCWVESSAMPFAEYHYPFENKAAFETRSPGDFVSEYIGQTRAWFYYLHAMSVSLFGRAAFRNVLTTGTILAADGAKLSKSKKNYTDPYELFDRYGADAYRYYLMGSVVMQAEDLTFRDEDVKEAHARVVNMLRNVLAFYELFKEDGAPLGEESPRALDRWIRARLRETARAMTDAFDAYDVLRAVRPIRLFVEDLSAWYVRRSRDRVKGEDARDKARALATLRGVLHVFSRAIAPVLPFVAEDIYRAVRSADEPESVHLAAWPRDERTLRAKVRAWFRAKEETRLLADMQAVRAVASEALQLRQKANVKVRQPLAKLFAPGNFSNELTAILAEELNVKEVVGGAKEIALDTTLTPELVREGDARAFARAVAEARKQEGFSPRDEVAVVRGEGPHTAELSFGVVRFKIIRR